MDKLFLQANRSENSNQQNVWISTNYCWWLRNPASQLRLVVYPIIYKVLAPSQGVSRISEPSVAPARKSSQKEAGSSSNHPFSGCTFSTNMSSQTSTKNHPLQKNTDTTGQMFPEMPKTWTQHGFLQSSFRDTILPIGWKKHMLTFGTSTLPETNTAT